ncbi:MAG: alternative ribosome rescue aminoacyl-tRNA hydrolase ArfB [Alphaproteobacteria bacterium]
MTETSDTIAPDLDVPLSALAFTHIRASGPGGQNVNKVSSAVQLRFDARQSRALSNEVFLRLKPLAGRRMTQDGVIVITAERFRSQERNRADAIDRLVALLREATVPPKRRRPTRPSRGARDRRISQKKQRGQTKRLRGRASGDDG